MAETRHPDHPPATRRRMRIGSRLVILLVLPLAGLLAVAGAGMWTGATRSSEAAEVERDTELALVAYRLIDAVEAERSSLVDEGTSTPELRERTATLTEELTARGEAIGGELAVATRGAERRLSGADLVSERGLGGQVALDALSAAVDSLLDLAARAIDPAGAVDGAPAATVDSLARAQAASAEERDVAVLLSDQDRIGAADFQAVAALASAQAAFTELAAESAPPALAVQIREVGFAMTAADLDRRDVLARPTAAAWDDLVTGLEERTERLGELQSDAEVLAVAAVADVAEQARLLLLGAFLGAAALLIVSILLLRRATMTIALPLTDLARQAEAVADTRLPEAVAAQKEGGTTVHLPAVRATGAAEVHEVAAAFNEVQDTALRLAGEEAALRVNQAEALTNLGRRNQTLLARQLDFISDLEQRETDPAFLDHLFKLDHLASRMRRNAESLLILAGSETPRRRRRPAQISEVVRAAMSEVEEFERVRIGHLRDATVAGPAVIDLVHMLAELIENALGFSPPDTTVEIEGRSLGQGGYQFAVVDHGVGMSDVELQAANERLSGTEELVGMPTRYLGQYVVATLARKVGAAVRLHPSVGGRGVTAVVVLSGAAMVGEPDREAVASPLPGTRASRERGPAPFAPGAGVPVARPPAAEPSAVEPPRVEPAVPVTGVGAGLDGGGGFPPTSTPSFDDGVDIVVPPTAEDVAPVVPDTGGDADDWSGTGIEGFVPFDAVDRETPLQEQWAAFDEPVEAASEVPTPGSAPTPATAPTPDTAPSADPFGAFAPGPAVDPVPGADPDPARGTAAGDAGERELPPPPPDAPRVEWVGPAPESTPAGPSATDGPGAARTGGLARRVPGASLAGRGDPASTPQPAPERSADQVRSVLSSFQAGRARGRTGHADPTTTSTESDADASAVSVEDGRTTQ